MGRWGTRGAALIAAPAVVREPAAKAIAAGRALFEGAEGRPGRSDMQHKYTSLDARIIIITAAILLLLIAILFLNFFIRWALHRLFLARSQKSMDGKRGLSKRQVQALPIFMYSSSKPPTASMACAHPTFYPSLIPFNSHVEQGMPLASIFLHSPHHTTIISSKVGSPTTLKLDKVHQTTPSQSPSKGGSLMGDQVMEGYTSPTISNPSDQVMEANNSPTKRDEVVNIETSTKASDPTTHSEVKGASTIFQGCNPINGSTKSAKMAGHNDDNASSSTLCSICLVEFADGDTIRVLPTCQHYFHIGCIDLWLAKSSSCPACRANILEVTRNPSVQPTLQIQVVTSISR